jgi:hypothetical protein
MQRTDGTAPNHITCGCACTLQYLEISKSIFEEISEKKNSNCRQVAIQNQQMAVNEALTISEKLKKKPRLIDLSTISQDL